MLEFSLYYRVSALMELVSIIMPAYNAQGFIERSVQSVLNQSYPYWELIIIADDQQDYLQILKQFQISDSRIKFISTNKIASGASHARNLGIKQAKGNIIAILDADDSFSPQKLELCVLKLQEASVVSCALELRNLSGLLGYVGTSISSGLMASRDYKRINFSGDSMIVFDRTIIPVTYDEEMQCLEDLAFMLNCFEYTDTVYHFSLPLHQYYKETDSLSHQGKMIDHKKILLKRLEEQRYNFVDPKQSVAMRDFLETSMKAETRLIEELAKGQKVIFEDLIAKLL
jgi:glycosyltransferase involved in cell wall biosynthesis